MSVKKEEVIEAEIQEKLTELKEVEDDIFISLDEREYKRLVLTVEISTLSWVLGQDSGLSY